MRTADDDSIPIPHDTFRVPRGALKWKTPYLTVLLLLAGAYGVLVLAGGLTPSLQTASSAREPLRLPLLAQLALGCAGLAALVWVLARAVREVDKRPYVAIAPVFATFAGLVHAGLRVDLSALGMSSALIAFGVLAVALIGGALIVRLDTRSQRLGWGLVIAPWLVLLITLALAKGDAPFTPPERGYAAGLLFSNLVLGAAGLASRALRSALTQPRAADANGEPKRSVEDELGDVPTGIMPAPAHDVDAAGTARHTIRARAVQPRGRSRLVWIASAVAALVYFALRAAWGGDAAVVAPTIAAAPAAAPVVQQLSTAAAPAATRSPNTAPHATKLASTTLREPPPAGSPALTSGPHAATPARVVATPARKAVPVARKEVSAPPSPAGLPAWGDVATIKSSASKPSASAKAAPSASSVPTAKVAPSASSVAPARATRSAAPAKSAPAKSAPATSPAALAAKPAAPAKPATPSKPLTMDQVLDRVESAAKAQRKEAHAPPAKTGKHDAELDALITGSMKPTRK